jgi:hypothetical protein
MTFRNWSEVCQNREWAKFANAWKAAIRYWPEAGAHGFSDEGETERLLLAVINKCVERGIRKLSFDQMSPDLISTDGIEWATINPAFATQSKPPFIAH